MLRTRPFATVTDEILMHPAMRRVAVATTALLAVAFTTTAALATCPPAPRAACRVASGNALVVSRTTDAGAERFTWTWSGGAPTAASGFGDPTRTTALDWCVYDASGLVAGVDLAPGGDCAGKPCWQTTRSGFTYRDPSRAAGGIDKLMLSGSPQASARIRL